MEPTGKQNVGTRLPGILKEFLGGGFFLLSHFILYKQAVYRRYDLNKASLLGGGAGLLVVFRGSPYYEL